MFEKEEILHGGNVNNVVRIGNTVHRSVNWSPYVHELLLYLEKQGFDGAPKFIGIDEKGCEILSYIEGEVSGNDYPDFKPYIWSEDSLIRCAQLLRRYHDAVQGFIGISDYYTNEEHNAVPGKWENEVVCHNDAALYNIVFKDEVPVALIDFDLAKPGPRIWDIVYMLYTSVPLASFAIDYNTGKSIPYNPELHAADRTRRISLFMDAYGIKIPHNIKEWTISRIKALCDTLTIGAANGNEAYRKMIDEGHLAHYKWEIIFLKEHFKDWME
ncbi:phosphotransferase [Anaerocolumna sedimenticola]|uniref:Phosphotransferase n=1 Tax=Anaerocolumna sedimenticola TaxID=2696063 RepID=A0A6P1TKS0_9FIRM|nr:aminoglycoside phosphotransferase family protein [Anaerocolumna sedimenticola]QHQ61033.1 phosphotransferase [Anaerocolumna sedimenticola]